MYTNGNENNDMLMIQTDSGCVHEKEGANGDRGERNLIYSNCPASYIRSLLLGKCVKITRIILNTHVLPVFIIGHVVD
jgi:hypothetical protein